MRLSWQALDVHGRDWKAAAAYVGSRDARAFTSHAQKHFIKLCLAGKPLPPKVAETGLGYTLSGKPLDPNSAAAKAYGFKPDSLASESFASLPVVEQFLVESENDVLLPLASPCHHPVRIYTPDQLMLT